MDIIGHLIDLYAYWYRLRETGGAAPLFDRQPGLSTVERLDLAFLVDAEDDGMGRRIDPQVRRWPAREQAPRPTASLSLSANLGASEILNAHTRCGWSPCPFYIRRTEDGLIPTALAIDRAVQWVASCGGAWLVSAMTRSTISAGSGGMREGRVWSRMSPSTPSCMKRSCQRHTTVLPLPTARVMAVVPLPSAVSTIIRAPHTCLCGLFAIPDDRLQAHAISPGNGDGNSFTRHQQSHETQPSETPFRTLLSDAFH